MKALPKKRLSLLCLLCAMAPLAAHADVVFARPVTGTEAGNVAATRMPSPSTYSFVDVYRLSTESQRGLARVGPGAGAGPSGMLEVDALGAPVGLAWSGAVPRPRMDGTAELGAVPLPRAGVTIAQTPEAPAETPVDGLALLSGFAVVAFIVLRRAGMAS